MLEWEPCVDAKQIHISGTCGEKTIDEPVEDTVGDKTEDESSADDPDDESADE